MNCEKFHTQCIYACRSQCLHARVCEIKVLQKKKIFLLVFSANQLQSSFIREDTEL